MLLFGLAVLKAAEQGVDRHSIVFGMISTVLYKGSCSARKLRISKDFVWASSSFVSEKASVQVLLDHAVSCSFFRFLPP